jgi:hypothetical protein
MTIFMKIGKLFQINDIILSRSKMLVYLSRSVSILVKSDFFDKEDSAFVK